MIRKNIYRWHRRLSLIIALPVVLWAISGFMHPIMTTFRPGVASQFYTPPPLDTAALVVPIHQALAKQGIREVQECRIVFMGNNWFYQVRAVNQPAYQYISSRTGQLLKHGDKLYARHLAKAFLKGNGNGKNNPQPPTAVPLGPTATQATGSMMLLSGSMPILPAAEANEDCCMMATYAVLNDTSTSAITAVEAVKEFNGEYTEINRLLPVYRVQFDRADGIRIYVETGSDKFAYAVDHKRAAFDAIFRNLHTLDFLEPLGKGRIYLELLLMGTAMVTALMGLYIFFTTKGKRNSTSAVVRSRYNHRWTSVTASLFTLMFTLSGAWHAFSKLTPDNRHLVEDRPVFAANNLQLSWPILTSVLPDSLQVTSIRPVLVSGAAHWQVSTRKKKRPEAKEQEQQQHLRMKDRVVPPPHHLYLNMTTQQLLQDGEKTYANELAIRMSKLPASSITGLEPITKFEGEYGFVNKRLPVWKVSMQTPDQARWYVETSTGKLGATITQADLPEGYSFALLHKHHYMDWAGKAARDGWSMFWAAMQVAMVGVGLALWWRSRKRKQNQTA